MFQQLGLPLDEVVDFDQHVFPIVVQVLILFFRSSHPHVRLLLQSYRRMLQGISNDAVGAEELVLRDATAIRVVALVQWLERVSQVIRLEPAFWTESHGGVDISEPACKLRQIYLLIAVGVNFLKQKGGLMVIPSKSCRKVFCNILELFPVNAAATICVQAPEPVLYDIAPRDFAAYVRGARESCTLHYSVGFSTTISALVSRVSNM